MTFATEPRPTSFPWRARGVTAVLGPTNTGKTHLAIERMLGHASGVIGLPLRLLAREVYGKIVDRVGPDAVALVTGEEKIKPPSPKYWVSTVEAMPRDLSTAFVAVDEVQLAADLERGHVFTDRLLHARGTEETLLLGALTVRPLIEKLLPGVSVVTRPRLSQLTYSGEKKLTRLPARTAIVAFSSDDVYAIAELIRRQRGGAAVVMGALSPRTRNAQVALYQNGDVDFLIATDAIGMGLNLDVDHIAFASVRKFDGYQFRDLNPGELGQIAGRAGRYMKNGTFGVTGDVKAFPADLAQALEAHDFEPVKVLQWRNTRLDFATLEALRQSLAEPPREAGLTRAPTAEDAVTLDIAARDEEIVRLARGPEAVARLWEVAQVPDYRKIAPANHADLVFSLYRFLMERGSIPEDWFAGQIAYADRTEGDIDTLSARIAHVRTWTFVANRPDWLADPAHWQGVTRAVEDKLSDALHERLTQRFVDRRTSVLMRRLRENAMLEAEINDRGDVLVEGQFVGHLTGFRFAPDASAEAVHGKALRAAAQKALASEIERRANRLAGAGDQALVLSSDGHLRWEGEPVARLTAGEKALEPRINLLADSELTGPQRDRVAERLEKWLENHRRELVKPLVDLEAGDGLEGMARGIAFQIVEGFGILERTKVSEEVRGLDQAARAKLRQLGVRFGAHHIYVPALLKPAPRTLLTLFWAVKEGQDLGVVGALSGIAASGRTSVTLDPTAPKEMYRMLGYRAAGTRAVRIDILERLADLIRPALAWRQGTATPRPEAAIGGGFRVTGAMTSLLGCSGEDFLQVLRSLGYRSSTRKVAQVELDAWKSPPPAVAAILAEGRTAEATARTPAPPTVQEPAEAETAVDDAVAADAAPESSPAVQEPIVTDAAIQVDDTAAGPEPVAIGNGSADVIEVAEVETTPVLTNGAAVEASAPAAVVSPESAVATATVEDVVLDTAPSDPESPGVVTVDAAHEPVAEAAIAETASIEAADVATAEPATTEAVLETIATEDAPDVLPADASAEAVAAAPAAPTPDTVIEIEVWHPGRRNDDRRRDDQRRNFDRRPRHDRAQPADARRSGGGREAVPEPAAEAQQQPQQQQRNDGHRPEHRGGGRPMRGPQPMRGGGAAERHDRPRGPRPERPQGPRPEFKDKERRREERAPDPNSPFAALAKLKAELEARAKRGG